MLFWVGFWGLYGEVWRCRFHTVVFLFVGRPICGRGCVIMSLLLCEVGFTWGGRTVIVATQFIFKGFAVLVLFVRYFARAGHGRDTVAF